VDLPTDFEASRQEYYEALKQPTSAQAFTDKVQAAKQNTIVKVIASPNYKLCTHSLPSCSSPLILSFGTLPDSAGNFSLHHANILAF
jgi:hypothetical protein